MRKQNVRPWLCLVAAFMMLFVSSGLGTNGMSLFYVPVTEALGFSQTEFSVYYSITSYVAAIAAPFMGRFITKKIEKMKMMLGVAGILMFLCFFLYSRCSTLPAFYAVSAVRGIANCILSYVSVTTIINNWFVGKRAFAMSIAMMGSSAGGLVFTQLSRIFLENFGWRGAYLAVGVASFIINLIMFVLVQPAPRLIGLEPYGVGEEVKQARDDKSGVTFKQAVSSPAFWLLLVSIFISGITIQGTQQAVTTALQLDYGHSQALAANVMSILMLVLCFGKLVVGRIFDKKGLSAGILYCCVLVVAAFICLLLAKEATFAIIFAVVFGLGNMFGTIIPPTATTAIFGLKEYGAIFGFVSMLSTLGNATGTTISATLYDATGSYAIVWVIYGALNILATVMIIAANAIMKKYKKANGIA